MFYCLSQPDAAGRTIYVKVPRGKSLSPPKIGSNRLSSNRSLTQRHPPRPFHILRRQKFLQKVRQQANKSSSPRHSPTTMGKSIPKDIVIKSTEQPNDKAHASDDSEYSSLEDDDDVQGMLIIITVSPVSFMCNIIDEKLFFFFCRGKRK